MRELIWSGFVLEAVKPVLGAVNSSPQNRVCAVIVTYNIGEAIHRCFNSIQDQVTHVLIVDNASGEPTRRELNKLASFDSTTLILNERNEGLAHAFNQAVEWAKGNGFQWILTLDHDSEATPGMVDKLLRACATLEEQGIQDLGLIGANPFDVNAKHFLLFTPQDDSGLPVENEETISSGCLISLRVFDKVERFNEDLFMYYVDTDFCMRVLRAGFRVYICPDAVLMHKEGSKMPRKFLWIHANYDHYGKAARYYLMRNSIYMIKRHPLSIGDYYWMVRRHFKDHMKILLFDKERLSVLGYSLKGLIDGLRGKVGPMSSSD